MTSFNPEFDLAHGEVVNVQQIRSRGVTRIEIEVPIESHVKATNLLFGKNALVIPVWERSGRQVAFGVAKLSQFLSETPANDDASTPQLGGVPATGSGFTGSPLRAARDYVKYAGALCRDNRAFWAYLSGETGATIACESDAANCLRALLGIGSRAELATNHAAQQQLDDLVAGMNAEAQNG